MIRPSAAHSPPSAQGATPWISSRCNSTACPPAPAVPPGGRFQTPAPAPPDRPSVTSTSPHSAGGWLRQRRQQAPRAMISVTALPHHQRRGPGAAIVQRQAQNPAMRLFHHPRACPGPIGQQPVQMRRIAAQAKPVGGSAFRRRTAADSRDRRRKAAPGAGARAQAPAPPMATPPRPTTRPARSATDPAPPPRCRRNATVDRLRPAPPPPAAGAAAAQAAIAGSGPMRRQPTIRPPCAACSAPPG